MSVKNHSHVFITYTVCLLLLIPIGSVLAEDWPMFGQGPSRTGYSTASLPSELFFKWGSSHQYGCISPVLSDDNLFFIGTYTDDTTVCMDATTGEILWTHPVGYATPEQYSSPAVYEDVVFVGGSVPEGNLYCLDAKGNGDGTTEELWSFPLAEYIKSPVVADERVIFSARYSVFCLDADPFNDGDEGDDTPGQVLYDDIWRYEFDDQSPSPPVVYDDNVYVIAGDTVYCLNAENGNLIWNYELGENADIYQPCMAAADGLLFAVTRTSMYCLDTKEKDTDSTYEYWSFEHGGTQASTPALKNDKLYVAVLDTETEPSDILLCVNTADGAIEWTKSVGGKTAPSLSAEWLYTISSDDTLTCLYPESGEIKWTYQGHGLDSQPIPSAIGEQGVLFIADSSPQNEQGTGLTCLAENNPPSTPSIPQGPNSGKINTEYSFSSSASDPEGDTLLYQFNWGDGTTSPWTTQSSLAHTWSTTGTYEIKVRAKDTYDFTSSWSTPATIVISEQQQIDSLVLTAPSSVVETTQFTVTVTADLLPVKNVTVVFNEHNQLTNTLGKATFTAPEVDYTNTYVLTALKEGYIQDNALLVVQNIQEDKGWMFGIVTNDEGTILPNAQVCILRQSTNTPSCLFTNEQGMYLTEVEPGTYTVYAHKQGYQQTTETSVTIQIGEAREINHILYPKDASGSPEEDDPEVIEYLIEQKAAEGSIAAKIIVMQPSSETIIHYNQDIIVTAISTEESIAVTVSADDGTQGTFFVVSIDETMWENLDNVQVVYDDDVLEDTSDIGVFFSKDTTDDPTWIAVQTKTGAYILLWVPHFSEHTIILQNVVQTLLNPLAIALYIIIAVVTGTVFVGTSATRMKRLRRYYNKKEE